jgi:hypothetical protein
MNHERYISLAKTAIDNVKDDGSVGHQKAIESLKDLKEYIDEAVTDLEETIEQEKDE